jgi:hypothetical protein
MTGSELAETPRHRSPEARGGEGAEGRQSLFFCSYKICKAIKTGFVGLACFFADDRGERTFYLLTDVSALK